MRLEIFLSVFNLIEEQIFVHILWIMKQKVNINIQARGMTNNEYPSIMKY